MCLWPYLMEQGKKRLTLLIADLQAHYSGRLQEREAARIHEKAAQQVESIGPTEKRQVRLEGAYIGSENLHLIEAHIWQVCDKHINRFGQWLQQIAL